MAGRRGGLAADLAALCHDAGRLAERLEARPGGAERLALQEAASLSWWSGDRIGADRLGLWLALRLGATGEDAPGVARAAWAARRLGAARPRAGDWGTVIGGHLGLSGEDRVGDPSRVGQTGLDHLAAAESRSEAALDHLADTCEGLEPMAGLSPVTLGCLGFHLWRMPDPAPPDALPADPRVREVEAAVLGARLAAGFGAGQGLLFLPLTPDRVFRADRLRPGRAAAVGLDRRGASGHVIGPALAETAVGLASRGSAGHRRSVRSHARPADRLPRPLAAGLGAAGRSGNRGQPRRRAAQPGSAGGKRIGAGGHRAGQVPGLGRGGVRATGIVCRVPRRLANRSGRNDMKGKGRILTFLGCMGDQPTQSVRPPCAGTLPPNQKSSIALFSNATPWQAGFQPSILR